MELRQDEALSPQLFMIALVVISETGIIGLPLESVCVDDLSLSLEVMDSHGETLMKSPC